MKYKVGDFVRVIKNSCCHGFEIGEIVRIETINNNEDVMAVSNLYDKWWIYTDEIEPYVDINKIINNEVEIQIKYFSDKIDKLAYIDGKSDWIDLRSAERVELKAGEHKIIHLGIGMKLPVGYEAHIVPRSSTFKNFGVLQTNHMGVVDNTYCGNDDEWCFSALAMRDTVIDINDRICQFRIIENQPKINFIEVANLKENNRGGFGSTGKQ